MSTLNRILTARRFAIAAHGNQTYGPDLPYEYHLEKAQAVSRELIDDEMLFWAGITREQLEVAIWLHDVVEDTPVTTPMIEAVWGHVVACMVDCVTKPDAFNKIKDDRGALVVKLCDRIANVQACLAGTEKLPANKRKRGMIDKYRREQSEFRALRTTSPLGPVWDHLEQLLATEPR